MDASDWCHFTVLEQKSHCQEAKLMGEKQNNDDETKMQTDEILLTFASTNRSNALQLLVVKRRIDQGQK